MASTDANSSDVNNRDEEIDAPSIKRTKYDTSNDISTNCPDILPSTSMYNGEGSNGSHSDTQEYDMVIPEKSDNNYTASNFFSFQSGIFNVKQENVERSISNNVVLSGKVEDYLNTSVDNPIVLDSDSDNEDNSGSIRKLDASLENDLDLICSLVCHVDRTLVWRRLLQVAVQNRVEVVVNEALEGNLEDLVSLHAAQNLRPATNRLQPDIDNVNLRSELPSTSIASSCQVNDIVPPASRNADSGHRNVQVGDPQTIHNRIFSEYTAKACNDDEFLLNDAMAIAEMMPNSDQNFVYTRLSALRENPDRLQLVLDELLDNDFNPTVYAPLDLTQSSNDGSVTTVVFKLEKPDSLSDAVKTETVTKVAGDVLPTGGELDRDVELVLFVVPHANREYVTTILRDLRQDDLRVAICINLLQGHETFDITNDTRKSIADYISGISMAFELSKRNHRCSGDTDLLKKNPPPSTFSALERSMKSEQKPHTVTSGGDNYPNERPCSSRQAAAADDKAGLPPNDIRAVSGDSIEPSDIPVTGAGNDTISSDSLDAGSAMMNSQSQDTQSVGSCDDFAINSSEELFDRALSGIISMFPDCDPEFIASKLEHRLDEADICNTIITEMLADKSLPKRSDKEKIKQSESNRLKLLNSEFDIDAFLEMFPDPVTYFSCRPHYSKKYLRCAQVELRTRFYYFSTVYIHQQFSRNKCCFGDTVRNLRYQHKYIEDVTSFDLRRKHRHYRMSQRAPEIHDPRYLDEFFIHERHFVDHEQEIADYFMKKKQSRDLALESARTNGELMECPCCFDDELLISDMSSCTSDHLFCHECIRRASEVKVAEAKFTFTCIHDGCDAVFPITVLKTVLTSQMFSTVVRKIQEEEVRSAGIDDLVACPYCEFATIMPDQNNKVLKCLNTDCLKETCRLCKQENHVPLRCSEVDIHARKLIEERMTQAMLRTCASCGTKFYKTEGCNKMTCMKCGTTMCYICRKSGVDYNHFDNTPQGQRPHTNCCLLWSDVFQLHDEETEVAAQEARVNLAIQSHQD